MFGFVRSTRPSRARRTAIVARIGAAMAATLAVAVSPWFDSGTATAAVAAPDLSGYTEVAVPVTVDSSQNRHTYFKTPGGLHCGFGPSSSGQIAGCDAPGGIPGGPAGATSIVMSGDPALRGFRNTSAHAFTRDDAVRADPNDPTPVVRVGGKVIDGDVECAVTGSQNVACTKGSPAMQWMVATLPTPTTPNSGIGPATDGLPDGFPDPIDYVADQGGYNQFSGVKNSVRTFTVDRGLTCELKIFSGGEVGCDGTLPGVQQGENEVSFTMGGESRVRRVDTANFSPADAGKIQRMPVGHRFDFGGATCMATDGGVACIGRLAGRQSAFQVTPTGVITY